MSLTPSETIWHLACLHVCNIITITWHSSLQELGRNILFSATYLLQSPRKATFLVLFWFVWPAKWVEDLRSVQSFYRNFHIENVWQLPFDSIIACKSPSSHGFSGLRDSPPVQFVTPTLILVLSIFDLCKSIESIRDFFATVVLLLSGACPVSFILLCFPLVHWEALRVCTSLHQGSLHFNLPQALHLICQALPENL